MSYCLVTTSITCRGIAPALSGTGLAHVFYAQAAEATTAKPRRFRAGYVAAPRTYMFVARVPYHGHETVASNNAIGATYHWGHNRLSHGVSLRRSERTLKECRTRHVRGPNLWITLFSRP